MDAYCVFVLKRRPFLFVIDMMMPAGVKLAGFFILFFKYVCFNTIIYTKFAPKLLDKNHKMTINDIQIE